MTGMLWFWAYFIFKGRREYGQSIRQFFGERWLTVRTLASDVVAGALVLVVILACTSATHALLPHVAIENPLLSARPQGIAGVMAWIVVSLSAGICEEIVFRGYLQRQLVAMTGNTGLAIVVQALAFGVGHTYEGLTALVNVSEIAFTLVFCVAQLANRSMWAEQEIRQLDLGDARLNRRATILMETMAATPTASVPKACNGWGKTMAAYRFFQQCQRRLAGNPGAALATNRTENGRGNGGCLQDTTELDFNGQQERGLGPLSYEAQRGMDAHPTR